MLRVCSWLSLRAAHRLGALIGWAAWKLQTESCRITRINLALCFPQLSQQEQDELAKRSLIETARTACELGQIWINSPKAALSKIVGFTGKEHLDAALAKGSGIIVLAPHLGNWELCGLYLDSCAQSTYLYKPPKLTAFEPKMLQYRSRLGAKLAPTSAKGVAMLLKALARGELVGILPDQEPSIESGVFAPFFGVEALTMTLVAKLANRTESSVLSIFAKRLEDSAGFEIVIQPARADVANADVAIATQALNDTVEDCVRLAPAQYQWEYRRFKRQADNTKNTLYR